MSPEFPGSDLLTWDLELVLNSTENFDDSHAIGETSNVSNYLKPLDRPFEHSAVGSEYVSENQNLLSRGDFFFENSMGSMSGEDSRATSPGGGAWVFFRVERVIELLPRLAEGRTFHPYNQYFQIKILKVLLKSYFRIDQQDQQGIPESISQKNWKLLKIGRHHLMVKKLFFQAHHNKKVVVGTTKVSAS